ncbi:MAG: ATP-binding protein [Betaproteobacteria bacterium]|nr:ATP-binding protein [Betaproteobacteria bacterium]
MGGPHRQQYFSKAKHIGIEFRSTDTPYIAVIDDGEGMSKDSLARAMRHGNTSPFGN